MRQWHLFLAYLLCVSLTLLIFLKSGYLRLKLIESILFYPGIHSLRIWSVTAAHFCNLCERSQSCCNTIRLVVWSPSWQFRRCLVRIHYATNINTLAKDFHLHFFIVRIDFWRTCLRWHVCTAIQVHPDVWDRHLIKLVSRVISCRSVCFYYNY